MVVVAIIGILAAVAIPQYSKYQARARQSEAKIGLAAAYTAEASYSAEQNTFTACLQNAGYTPTVAYTAGGALSSTLYYTIGFPDAVTTPANCGPGGDQACNVYGWSGTNPQAGATCAAAGPQAPTVYAPNGGGAPATYGHAFQNTVVAYAGGNVPAATGDLTNAGVTAGSLTQTAFIIGAVGGVSSSVKPVSGTKATWDSWTINQGKLLTNTIGTL
jgi:type II secretory pathway pseudopilin PulG